MKMKLPPPPTLAQMIQDARALNPDVTAFSLVREPTAERPPAVCIVLLGSAAIRRVGPLLQSHVRTLRDPGGEHAVVMDLRCTVAMMFEELERLDFDFGWHNPVIGGEPALITLIVGPSITEDFCAGLTARGCFTQLQ